MPVVLNSSDFANRTGTDNFETIRFAHESAKAASTYVVYPAGLEIFIEIPSGDTCAIELNRTTHDFNNCMFNVYDNHYRGNTNFCLFSYNNSIEDVDKTFLYNSNFNKFNLRNGSCILNGYGVYDRFLLSIKDENIWTRRKISETDYRNEYRYDIFLVEYGFIKNNPIYDYGNNYTDISVESCVVYPLQNNQPFIFKNLHFKRHFQSKAVDLLNVNGYENILIKNIRIDTPNQDYIPAYKPDSCIAVRDSYNVTFEDIIINGTYSSVSQSGYGIHLNNVYNTIVRNLSETTIWGVFCTNNLNKFYIENSNLNRVDVHCYGRDITCSNCTFRNNLTTTHRYNRFSSFFGLLKYQNCTFNYFVPVRLDKDYQIFTPFDVEFCNCTFNVNSTYTGLVYAIELVFWGNIRPKFHKVHLPNLRIVNATVNITDSLSTLYLFRFGAPYNCHVYNLRNIYVDFGIVSFGSGNTLLSETNHALTANTEGNPFSRQYIRCAVSMISNTYGITFV